MPPERLQQANGVRATAMSAGEIGGPVLAGVLVAAVGAGWALAFDAASFAASALLLIGVRAPQRAERAAASFWADLREGWDDVRRHDLGLDLRAVGVAGQRHLGRVERARPGDRGHRARRRRPRGARSTPRSASAR